MLQLNIFFALILTSLFLIAILIDFFMKGERIKNYIYRLLIILLIFFASIRIRGWDFENYRQIFLEVPVITDPLFFSYKKIEIGFRFLVSVIKTLKMDYRVFIILIAFVTLFLISSAISKNAKYKIMTISTFYFLYYIRGPYGQIRQALAMAILLCSFNAILKNERIKFLFLYIIAILIHTVSILFLPAYYFAKKELTKKKIYFLLFISILLSMVSGELINLVLKIDVSFMQRVRNYNTIFLVKKEYITLDMVRYLIFSLVITNYRNKMILLDKANKEKINLFILGTIIYNILSFNLRLASRMSSLYIIFEIFLIPDLIRVVERKELKAIILFLFMAFFMYRLILEFYMLKTGLINHYL